MAVSRSSIKKEVEGQIRGAKPSRAMLAYKKNKLKKYDEGTGDKGVQGPMQREDYAIEPQLRKSSSFDTTTKKDTQGASLYLHTPGYGKFGIHYDKDTDQYPNNYKLDTKRKSASYDIEKEIGPGTVRASTSLGKSENDFIKGKTKQGTISYTIPLGKKKGGVSRPGLYANINRRKKLGISRPKSKSTISKEAYSNMKKGFPKKKSHGGMIDYIKDLI